MTKMAKKTYNNLEKQTYNASLKEVEETNKKLLKIYKKANDNLMKLINSQIEKIISGRVKSLDKLAQTEILQAQVANQIEKLNKRVDSVIRSGYLTNYDNVYYSTAYNLEFAATQRFGYSLEFQVLNTELAAASLDELVGGETFRGRMLKQRLKLQNLLRENIATATIEGISTKELAKRLQDMRKSLKLSLSNATRIARTELLRAHSISNDKAIEQSIASGLEGEKVWNATLDSRTRPDHVTMDQKKADKDGYFTLPNGDRAKGPRMPGLSASQAINCRCYAQFRPFGITPTGKSKKIDDKYKKRISISDFRKFKTSLKRQQNQTTV